MNLSISKKRLFAIVFFICWVAVLGAETHLELGQRYEKQKNYTEAVKWYRKAAKQGDKNAQRSLGMYYVLGRGLEKDDKQAVYWFRKAAEQGDKVSQSLLGRCYYGGNGVKKDYKQAVYWFRKAAEQGMTAAQTALGDCYEKGYGLKKDSTLAVYWWTKAAEQGDTNAQTKLNLFHYDKKNNVHLIENGDKQYVTKESTENEKFKALWYFRYRCSCSDIRKRFSIFFNQDFDFFNQDINVIRNQVSKYNNVIQFIQEEYQKPIIAHKYKILEIRETPVASRWWSYNFDTKVRSGCTWHTLMLAQKGMPEAQYYMGKSVLSERRPSETELTTAFKWLFHAGDSGYSDAYYISGLICGNDNNYKDMIKCWKTGIMKGNVMCMVALADFCFGKLHDYTAALKFYKMAAECDHYGSVFACATIYQGLCNGVDTSLLRNSQLAIKYYKKLVELEIKFNGDDSLIKSYKEEIKKLQSR